MGDNRQSSLDSRDGRVGFVSKDKIVGMAFFRVFPFNKIGRLK
jgi:signal peptidase I